MAASGVLRALGLCGPQRLGLFGCWGKVAGFRAFRAFRVVTPHPQQITKYELRRPEPGALKVPISSTWTRTSFARLPAVICWWEFLGFRECWGLRLIQPRDYCFLLWTMLTESPLPLRKPANQGLSPSLYRASPLPREAQHPKSPGYVIRPFYSK